MTDLPPSSVPVQQESNQFNNPVPESSLASIGAVANYLLNIMAPIGTIWGSMLEDVGGGSNPDSFQGQLGFPSPATWVLADGRNVAGSAYQTVTGNANVPDLRGILLRGLNNGGSLAGTRTDSYANPDDPSGTFAPGQETLDKLGSHIHITTMKYNNNIPNSGASWDLVPTSYGGPVTGTVSESTAAAGQNETAPKNASINWFIRIN